MWGEGRKGFSFFFLLCFWWGEGGVEGKQHRTPPNLWAGFLKGRIFNNPSLLVGFKGAEF